MAHQYPKHMYHATLPPKYVLDKKAEDEASAQGYEERYIRQNYPRHIYHESGSSVLVKSEEEQNIYIGEDAKRKGWALKPFPVEPKAEDASSISRAPDSRIETENFQKIQEVEFALETLTTRYDKLFDAVDAQATFIEALSARVDALTPKKAKEPKEPEKVAS